MLLQFKKRDSLEKIHEIFEVYSKSKCSKLKVSLSENGRHEVLDENKNLLIINPKIDSFSILNQILEYYKGAIGIDECYFIFNKIEKCSYFSEHIIKKAKDAIFSKNIYFKFEAQFPPIIIRRPEKNTYYATTFNVILTKFICLAHEKSIELKTNPDLIIFQNMERCDRCSMRLIQNLFLYLKKFPFNFEFVFKHNSNLSAETSFCIDSYIKSRKHCFKKILAVSQTVGGIDDFLDVNDFVDKIDFYDSFFYNKEHVCWNENLSEIDNMMDLIYKSNYEKFYCLFELFPENKKEENYTNLNKLLLLANSYNYNFNDSLYTIRNIKLENVQDIIYFKFMEGLIVLKKNKDLELSESIFNECTKIIDGEVKCLELEIERGFIDNAKNLIKVIKISSLKDKDLRSIGISKIIENEHQILNRLLSSYISSPDAKINDKHNLLSLNFIITTVLGNISKLYSMIGDHLSIVKLYESYNYIWLCCTKI